MDRNLERLEVERREVSKVIMWYNRFKFRYIYSWSEYWC